MKIRIDIESQVIGTDSWEVYLNKANNSEIITLVDIWQDTDHGFEEKETQTVSMNLTKAKKVRHALDTMIHFLEGEA